MATYSLMCDQGHDAETMTVEAMNDDEAMEMMMAKCKDHFMAKHPDMNMTDDQVKDHIMSHWTKS